MIHYYYGFGKGKTTSALGVGMRAYGAGMKVLLVQFFKDNKSSELGALPFDVYESPDSIQFNPNKEDYFPWINGAVSYVKSSDADIVILDEFADLYPKYMDEKDIMSLLSLDKEIVITGHYKLDFLYDKADYVTAFQKEKHPYDKGVNARRGIEF